MQKSLVKIISIFLLTLAVTITGCGGGGGGGGAAGPQPSTTKVSESAVAKEFIAQQIAGNYNDLKNRNSPSVRSSKKLQASLKAAQTTEIGVGAVRITFQNDVVSLFGINYTYTSGYQNLTMRDSIGNLTNVSELGDSLEIDSNNVACTIKEGNDICQALYNGKLIFQGFYLGNNFTIKAQNLNVAGTINSIDSFNWTLNGNVTINQSSYPYPVNGSNESGILIFNGYQYNYTTSYNGTNVASVIFSGTESFSLTINLATGVVVGSNIPDSSSQLTDSIAGTWKLVEQDRNGLLLPVTANANGKVSETKFNTNKTVDVVSYTESTNNNINYWVTDNTSPETYSAGYSISGNQLTLTKGNESVTHTITIQNNRMQQTAPWGAISIWEKI